MAYDSSGAGAFVNFSGNYNELINGLRIKALETNGNFYFTTDLGIKKISVKNIDDLATATIVNAGAVEAIDLTANPVPSAAGFLPPQSKVAYRMVFGYKDANSNLLLGVPSARAVVSNTSQTVNESEIFTINVITYTGIADQDYFTFNTTDTGYFGWFNVGGSATAPINADTLDREGIEIKTQGATSNSQVAAIIANALSPITGITIDLSGTEIEVTIVGAGDVPNASQGSLSAGDVLITTIFDGSITEGTPAEVLLNFTLPQELTTEYFYQIYRTPVTTVQLSQTLNDIDPGDEEQFIFEFPITDADLLAGFISITDNTPETFRASGAPLYTNAITGGGRGIVDANDRPPIAQDMALFRQSTFYANTKDAHRFTFSILSVDNFVSGTSKFYIGRGGLATEYTFVGTVEVTDVQVQTRDLTVGNAYIVINSANNERSYYVWFDKGVIQHSFDSTTAVNAGTDTITVTAHGYATNDKVVLSGTVPGGLTAGTDYYVIRTDANNFQLSATVSGPAIDISTAVGTATIIHTPADPAVPSKLGVRVPLSLYDNTLAGSKQAFIDSILSTFDFDAVDFSSDTVRVTCIDSGYVDDPTLSTPAPGWIPTVFSQGTGENAAAREVLLSVNPSVAVSIDLTARSLVRVINQDSLSPVTAQYLSGPEDLPGKILLKAKTLQDLVFYVAVSDSSMSAEFSPELPVNVGLLSVDEPTNTFETITPHGLVIGDQVYINDNPMGTIVEWGGRYIVATVPTATTFTLQNVDVGVDQPGPLTGVVYKSTATSDNNVSPNRLYYSKISQPEAVPLVNFIDVGSKDKEIMRILALRDNLFVLKTDGVYLVTGASAPNFSVRLLDNSAILIAPDSAVVLNNLIYALTTQGVVSISESGVSIVSRQIEDQIKKFTTFNYNFRYTSFGVAYESDRSYLVWLPTLRTDSVATQCFRYSTITNTWTRWTKTNTCGIVNQLGDDRMYLGKGDGRNFIEQERKNDERQDYADRDFTRSIGDMAFNGTTVTISSIADVEAGDVMTQEQYVTVPKFNRFLKKLDTDTAPAFNDYYEKFGTTVGVNMGNQLVNFVAYLNTDTNLAGTFTTPSGSNSLLQLQEDYNTIINELNSPTSGTSLKNYKEVTDLLTYEVKIDRVIKNTNDIVINFSTWFIQGNMQIYKAIKSEVQWAPQHFGKAEMLKQISEGTLIFDQGTIYNATISYSSDRSADFAEIPFEMDGPGFWISYPWADIVWGGGSNSVPLRTYIPIAKSRCRFLNVKFKHFNAREAYKLLGISLEPREISSRGYR